MTLHQGSNSHSWPSPGHGSSIRPSDWTGLRPDTQRDSRMSEPEWAAPAGRFLPLQAYLRSLIGSLRSVRGQAQNHITAVYCADILYEELPRLVAARFFGKPTHLTLAPPDTEHFCRSVGRLGRAAIRLADHVQVTSRRAAQVCKRWGIDARLRTNRDILPVIPARTIRRVQPRILVFTSAAWRQDIVTILTAFAAVKSKYPRAELILAGPDLEERDGTGNRLVYSGVIRRRTESLAAFIDVCAEADILLASTPIDTTPVPVLAAMAAGLPAVIPPIGDIRPSTLAALTRSDRVARRRIVEAIIDMIEKPELAVELSNYSRECAQQLTGGKAGSVTWRLTG